jgi:PHD/YefM family antitoxin component YafN of YafNO toxin-antitoxin module
MKIFIDFRIKVLIFIRIMNRICATKAYKNFFKILDELPKSGGMEIVRNGGREGCYMISKEEYDGLIETMEIMKDRELYEKILQSMKDPDTVVYDSVDDLLDDLDVKR